MIIKLYDRVKLKNGYEASIVEIFEKGKSYLADIDYEKGTETEEVEQEEILQNLTQKNDNNI